jgi:hypothetical protein
MQEKFGERLETTDILGNGLVGPTPTSCVFSDAARGSPETA